MNADFGASENKHGHTFSNAHPNINSMFGPYSVVLFLRYKKIPVRTKLGIVQLETPRELIYIVVE